MAYMSPQKEKQLLPKDLLVHLESGNRVEEMLETPLPLSEETLRQKIRDIYLGGANLANQQRNPLQQYYHTTMASTMMLAGQSL